LKNYLKRAFAIPVKLVYKHDPSEKSNFLKENTYKHVLFSMPGNVEGYWLHDQRRLRKDRGRG